VIFSFIVIVNFDIINIQNKYPTGSKMTIQNQIDNIILEIKKQLKTVDLIPSSFNPIKTVF